MNGYENEIRKLRRLLVGAILITLIMFVCFILAASFLGAALARGFRADDGSKGDVAVSQQGRTGPNPPTPPSAIAPGISTAAGGTAGAIGGPSPPPMTIPKQNRISYRVDIDGERLSPERSLAALPVLNEQRINDIQGEAKAREQLKAKEFRQYLLIEGEKPVRLMLKMGGVVESEFDLNAKDDELLFPIEDLHLKEATRMVELEGKFGVPAAPDKFDFDVVVTYASGESIAYKLPQDLWIFFTYG